MRRLGQMNEASAAYHVITTYLDWVVELPWSTYTEDQLDIGRAEDVLNQDHYGLQEVKKRILEYLAVRQLKPDAAGPILCFVGPPGVGKTSLGQSIARAMGRPPAGAAGDFEHLPAGKGAGEPGFHGAQVMLSFGLVIDALVIGRTARVIAAHAVDDIGSHGQSPGTSRPGLKMPSGAKARFSSRWMRSSGGAGGAKAGSARGPPAFPRRERGACLAGGPDSSASRMGHVLHGSAGLRSEPFARQPWGRVVPSSRTMTVLACTRDAAKRRARHCSCGVSISRAWRGDLARISGDGEAT